MAGREGRRLLFGLGALLCALAAGAAEPVGLREATAEALAAHPDAEAARAAVAAAEARYGAARAGSMPSLGARVSYVQTNNPMAAFGAILSQGTFDPSVNFNDPGQVDALTGALEARYRIYGGGAIQAGQRAAQQMRRSSEQQLIATEAELSEAVAGAYFGIVQVDEAVAALEAGIRVLQENLRISQAREQAGELFRTERLNLEVQVAELQRELLAQRHNAQMARLQLGFLMGRDPGYAAEPRSGDTGPDGLELPGRVAVEQRAELAALRAAVAAAREGVSVAGAGGRPTVDAFASVQADKGWRREGDGDSWTAGISLNLPIFEGGSTRSAVAEARARVRQTEQMLRRATLGLHLEYEEARLAHELANEQKSVAAKMVEQADESAQLSRERYAAGTLLSTELIGVESRLIQARMQLAVATANERIVLVRLRRAAGQPIFQ